MWVGLWVLDCELVLSMGDETVPGSELVDELAAFTVFAGLPAPLAAAAASESIAASGDPKVECLE
jgi:hypothetical protein